MALNLVKDLRQAAPPNPSLQSNTKWNPARDVLAEALHLAPDDVYLATVSKSGNLSVRLSQSPGANGASVVGAMYPGTTAAEIEKIERAASQHLSQMGRELVLVFADSSAWDLVLLLHRSGVSVPSVLGAAWPKMIVLPV